MACTRLVALGGALRCCSDAPRLSVNFSYASCAAVGDVFPALAADAETRVLLAERIVARGDDASLVVGRYFADDPRVVLNGTAYCPFSFSYALPHDEGHGWPRCDDVDAYTRAATCPSTSTLDALSRVPGATKRLEGLVDAANAAAHATRGRDADVPTDVPRFAPVGSSTFAYDLAEAYAMAHLRDVPLDALGTSGTASYAEAERVLGDFLRRFAAAPLGLRPETLFRCPDTLFAPECRAGPYVSQLLFADVFDGYSLRDRRFLYERDTANLTVRARLLDVHRGFETTRAIARDGNGQAEARYVHSGRVLGSIVHGEPPFKHYYDAALASVALLGPWIEEVGTPAVDGVRHPAVAASTTAGQDDLLTSVAEVTLRALRQSYAYKWLSHRKMRPDQAAMRLDTFRRADALGAPARAARDATALAATLVDQFFGDSTVKAAFMEELADANAARAGERNYLLASLYEGPGHPSSTHGHAVVAGAATTVLKAMLTTTHPTTDAPLHFGTTGAEALGRFVNVRTATTDGASVTSADLSEETRRTMTLEGELDKLAHNLGAGRNWAGVHFRTELEYSLALGEAVGVAYLRDKVCEYRVARTNSFAGWNLRLFNGTRLRLRECNATATAGDVDADADGFGPHTVPGTARNFERLRPKPQLRVDLAAPIDVDALRLRQRQMAFGDASIRRALVTINDFVTHEVTFGDAPTVDGANGTLLTDLADDPYGRCGDPASVEVPLGNTTAVSSVVVTVDEVFDLRYPSDELAWQEDATWGVCDLGAHTVAGTAANFARLTRSPELRLDVAPSALGGVTRVELTQRQMAFGDASIATADVVVNDRDVYRVRFGAPDPLGVNGTLLTDLRLDPYGRAGTPAPVRVDFSAPTNVTRLRVLVREIHDMALPPIDVCVDDHAWQRRLDYSAYARGGSWNVGLVNATFYVDETTLVDPAYLQQANASANGAFQAVVDGIDIFSPLNPFRNAYPTLSNDTVTSFVNGDGVAIAHSWCWWGESVLAGLHGGADGFQLRDCYDDVEQGYLDYARNGSWNVGLTELSFWHEGALVPEAAVVGGAHNVTANGAFAAADAATGEDIFAPSNPLRNAYGMRRFDNGVGCNVPYSWCWFGEAVLAGTQNAAYRLAAPTTVAFGFHDVPGTPENFLFLTPKPRLTMTYRGAAPLRVDEVRFVQRQMAFGDSTIRRADVSLNGDVYEIAFGKAVPGDPDGTSGSLWTDLSLDQYGRFGNPQPVRLQLPVEIDLVDFAVDVQAVWPFEPPLNGTGGSTGDCGGRDIYTDYTDPTSGMSGGGKDRFGVLTRFGAWNVGFVSIEFFRAGTRVANYLADATVDANGWQSEEVSMPINAFKNPYEADYPDYQALVGSTTPDPLDPLDVCNNHQRAWSWFGTRVLGGFEPNFRLVLNPNLVTTQQYVEQVGAANLPPLLVQLALDVGEAGFVPE